MKEARATEPDNYASCGEPQPRRTLRAENRARESDRDTHAHANQHVCTRTHTTNHPRTHAHMINGTGRSAGATPRRLTRRGRPAPTAAAVHGAEAGARRLGLPAPTTSTLDHTPTLPTRLPHTPDGKTGFEEWEAGEVGGSKKGPRRLLVSSGETGPGVPAGRRMGVQLPKVRLCGSRVPRLNKYFPYTLG